MSLSLTQTKTALAVNLTASFLAIGGLEPYVYSVIPGGVGGSIDSGTGIYTAPGSISENPGLYFDTVQVIDDNLDTATATILVGSPLILFMDILQKELGLASDHIFLWDQKLFQPKDSGMYVIVGISSCKAFGVTTREKDGDWSNVEQSVNMQATCEIDVISRGPAARDRKEEIILALSSLYSQSQQEANSFYIGSLPAGGRFINLSSIDGAAIPYRFRISVNLQYAFIKSKPAEYFDTFDEPNIVVNS